MLNIQLKDAALSRLAQFSNFMQRYINLFKFSEK